MQALKHWIEAQRDLTEAASLDPGSTDVKRQQESLQIAHAEFDQEAMLAAADVQKKAPAHAGQPTESSAGSAGSDADPSNVLAKRMQLVQTPIDAICSESIIPQASSSVERTEQSWCKPVRTCPCLKLCRRHDVPPHLACCGLSPFCRSPGWGMSEQFCNSLLA